MCTSPCVSTPSVYPEKSSHSRSVSSVSSQARLSQSSSNSHSLLQYRCNQVSYMVIYCSYVQRNDTYRWFSIFCICSFIRLADVLLDSSSLAPPPSLSETLSSSPSPLFCDCPLGFLVRRPEADGGVGTWWVEACRFSSEVKVFIGEWLLQTYLEDGNDVFAVPLLGDVTQASCDVDAPADVHVHLHGLFLNFALQIRQVLKTTSQKKILLTQLSRAALLKGKKTNEFLRKSW